MAITALDIKDKQFTTKFRGYNEQEVDEFLDIIVDDYEDLVRDNRELAARVKELEEKLAYFDEMKESLSQSVILAQETAEKVKASAADESANLINKANFNATHLVEEAKSKASEILRDATDEAKRVAIETEELKRQSRVFHQRLLAAVEGQLSLASAPEWEELLQPTAIYLQNSDAAFK
ncbi:MAG: DivIVA domain-containing protein, partial [Streptococcus sp.]